MLSNKTKQLISDKIQAILQEVSDDELPNGEIQFILHVDGKEAWSWANIKNNGSKNFDVPNILIRNLTV